MKEEFVEAGDIRGDLRNHGTDIIECWTDTDNADHGTDTKIRSVGCVANSGETEFYWIGDGLVQASDARWSLLEGDEDEAEEE